MNEHGDLPAPIMRKNYLKGVFNGAVFALGEAASNPGLVLTLLVRQLGGSFFLVSLLPVIQNIGYLLPQLIVGGRVQALAYKMPIYRRFALLRIIAMMAVVVSSVYATQIDSTIALSAIIICNALFYFGGGVTTLSFQDVVAKIIPSHTRGRFFGMRQLCGGLLAFLIGGPLVRWLLSDTSPFVFPYNFAIISLFSLCCYAMAMAVFATVEEPKAPQVVPAIPFIDALRAAPHMLRGNILYRRFIWARLCLIIGRIAEPFYIIYITEQLNLPKSTSGILIAAGAVAAALSNMLWGRLGDRKGMQWLLSFTGSLAVLPPLMMIAAPFLLPYGTHIILPWILLISLMIGMSADGIGIASMTFLLEVAPAAQRPLYMGLANTLLGIGAIVPIIGGVLITTVGYAGTYCIAAIFCSIGAYIAFQLQSLRATTTTTTAS